MINLGPVHVWLLKGLGLVGMYLASLGAITAGITQDLWDDTWCPYLLAVGGDGPSSRVLAPVVGHTGSADLARYQM
jgi:hypothetical protein